MTFYCLPWSSIFGFTELWACDNIWNWVPAAIMYKTKNFLYWASSKAREQIKNIPNKESNNSAVSDIS